MRSGTIRLKTRTSFSQLPGRLHKRGHRPDARLVLYATAIHAAFDCAPFKTASCPGWCATKRAEDHQHKGNVIDPLTLASRGRRREVVFLLAGGSCLPSRFYEAVSESSASLWARCGTHIHLCALRNIDKLTRPNTISKTARCRLWTGDTLRLNAYAGDNHLDNYRITEVRPRDCGLTDDCPAGASAGRERCWVTELASDKIAAYMTLYTVMVTLPRLSRLVPFLADDLPQPGVQRGQESAHKRPPVRFPDSKARR